MVEPSKAAEAQDSAGQAPAKSRRRHWGLVPVAGAAAALTAGLGGGAAYAYFTSTGSGTGHAATGSPVSATITAATPTATLLPGVQGSASFTVNNTNPFAVSFTTISNVVVVSSNPSGCLSTYLTVPGSVSPAITVGANSLSGTETIPVTLSQFAPSSCQGNSFTVTFKLSGTSS